MLSPTADRFYLELAMAQAEHAAHEGTFPIGAVLVGVNDQVLAVGRTGVYSRSDVTSHAEMEVLRHAGAAVLHGPQVGACTMYATMEPCLMCAGALILANIARVVWVLDDPFYGEMRSAHDDGRYGPLFASVPVTRAPEPDLEQRMRADVGDFRTGGAQWLFTTCTDFADCGTAETFGPLIHSEL